MATPVFWPGEFHELYSPRGHKESDTTEQLSLFISPCYSLELCIQLRISFPFSLAFCLPSVCKASSGNHFAFLDHSLVLVKGIALLDIIHI